jgi:hypothetical protein
MAAYRQGDWLLSDRKAASERDGGGMAELH